MEAIFLGTGAGVSSVKRGLACVVLRYQGYTLVFDCGEGTQRQMMLAKLGFGSRMKIFITHTHGDHILGLPGLLQTMSLLDRKREVEVYGPAGTRELVEAVARIANVNLRYPVRFFETKNGVVCKEKTFKVSARLMNHSVPNYAYLFAENKKPGKFHPEKARKLNVPEGPMWSRLQHGGAVRLPNGKVVKSLDVCDPPRQGVKIVYSGDTRPTRRMESFAENADLLIHESTFDEALSHRAKEDAHSTAKSIAMIAKKANVKRLVLTHISTRYDDPQPIFRQARNIFKASLVATDFLRLEI